MPGPITNKINEIIAARQSRLGLIVSNLEKLRKVNESVGKFDGLMDTIRYQMAQKEGEYYQLMAKDPTIEVKLKAVSTDQLHQQLNQQLAKLDLLKKRFERDCVQIAFVGYERQGKSTFIQSITDLDNSVIPAYSGTSCTGAVSIIHNWEKDDFKAVIEFYSKDEFVKIVNEKLNNFFPGKSMSIRDIEDLKTLRLPDSPDITDSRLVAEYQKFLASFVEHVDDYKQYINSPTFESHDKEEVTKYVAQYRMYDAPPEGDFEEVVVKRQIKYKQYFHRYIVVKSCNIYCKFNYEDSGKIVLVDTVGLGDASNNQQIEQEMFRVLEEDCDGAIDIFKPASLGDSFNDKQVGVLDNISRRLADRDPSQWLVYVLNKVTAEEGNNEETTGSIFNNAKNVLDKTHQVAWAKVINGVDQREVVRELIVPLLQLISTNLPAIDSKLMDSARKSGEELYQQYMIFCDSVSAVLSSSVKANFNTMSLFDKLFDDLKLTNRLGTLDEDGYAQRKNDPCEEIRQKIYELSENMYDYIPAEEEIRREVERAVQPPAGIYMDMANIFRNRIFDAFEDLNVNVLTPLQENVKEDIARVLYEEGLFGKIPLKKHYEEPSVEWLSQLCDEKLASNEYPKLFDAIRFILDYRINVEGLVEYNLARSVYNIDIMDQRFEPLQAANSYGNTAERVNVIFQQLCSSVSQIQRRIGDWCDDFSLIPNHSFYARVHKFREKLVFSDQGKKDLKNFYYDNATSIWRDSFASIEVVGQAFGKWNEYNKSFSVMRSESNFVLPS